jgi:cell division protein FtsQ
MMKLGNRRKQRQQYLLDVKVQTQGRLNRRLRWMAGIAAAVAVFMLTGYGLYRFVKFAAGKLAFENPRFAVAQIIIEDDGALTSQQVTQIAAVRMGQNLLSLDLDNVRRRLEMIPLVRRVEVRRMLPQKLLIHVEERIAVARLYVPGRESGDAMYLIDRTAVAMRPIRLPDGTVLQPQSPGPLPVLTGVTQPDVHLGKPVESEQVSRALRLLDRLEQVAAGSMMEVEQIDLSRAQQLTLTTKQRTIVKFDVEEFPQQLRRLSAILSWSQQRQKLVQTVDLTVNRGVPVTFMN